MVDLGLRCGSKKPTVGGPFPGHAVDNVCAYVLTTRKEGASVEPKQGPSLFGPPTFWSDDGRNSGLSRRIKENVDRG